MTSLIHEVLSLVPGDEVTLTAVSAASVELRYRTTGPLRAHVRDAIAHRDQQIAALREHVRTLERDLEAYYLLKQVLAEALL